MKNYPQLPCKVCGKTFQMRCANHRVCDTCKPEYRRMDNVLRLRGYRKEKGVRTIGSAVKCSDCSATFTLMAAAQHRCADCQKKFNTKIAKRWISSNAIKTNAYRKTAKENYYYGGNRIHAHERDGCKCIRCGSEKTLHLHHIDGRGKGVPKSIRNDSLDNLATLCNKCHRQVHVLTEKRLYEQHPDTVKAAFDEFVHSHCAPQA